jgi:hypothetical protein
MGIGFNGAPVIHRRRENLHRTKRARYHAGFTANAFLLIHLHTIIKAGNGFIRATACARRIFAMTARHRIATTFMFNHRNAWLKLLCGQDMLFVIVGHHAGDFTSMTPYTKLCIGKNKTIHYYPFACYQKQEAYFLWGYVITWGCLRWQWSFAQFALKSANNLVRINFFSCLMKRRFAPLCCSAVMLLMSPG